MSHLRIQPCKRIMKGSLKYHDYQSIGKNSQMKIFSIIDYIKEAFYVVRNGKGTVKIQKLSWADIRRLLPYLKPHWKEGLFGIILIAFSSLMALPGPYLTKYLIDDVIKAEDHFLLGVIVSFMGALLLLGAVVSILRTYVFTILNQEITFNIKKTLVHHILRLPRSFFDKNQTGYLMSRANEVGAVGFFFSPHLIDIAISLFRFFFSLSILFYMSWKLTLVVLFFLPFYYVSTKFYAGGFRTISQDVYEKGAGVSKQLQESLSGVDLVKSLATEHRETARLAANMRELLHSLIIRRMVGAISGQTFGLIGGLSGLIILWFSGRAIMRAEFTVGTYLAFTGYLRFLVGPVQNLASFNLNLQPAIAGLHRVYEFLDMVTEDQDPNRTIAPASLKGKVVFDKVTFAYDGKSNVLKDVSFTINPGERVAIVGLSGVGKSTILKLLLGLYPLQKGHILVDDIPLEQMVLSNLRERMGIVSQNIFLFNDTIRNNILYSKPDAREEDVIRVSKLADAHQFIVEMEEGYDTVVGERGRALSGGQMQRISIARVLLKNPDLIIFDEATSHLDRLAEGRIQKAMDTILGETSQAKTFIIVAHRLSTVLPVDRVLVLDDHRLVQRGTHADLIQVQGPYRELYAEAEQWNKSAQQGKGVR